MSKYRKLGNILAFYIENLGFQVKIDIKPLSVVLLEFFHKLSTFLKRLNLII